METATRLISTRRGAFVLSALVATLAGAMIVLYVARYRDSVKSNAAPVNWENAEAIRCSEAAYSRKRRPNSS